MDSLFDARYYRKGGRPVGASRPCEYDAIQKLQYDGRGFAPRIHLNVVGINRQRAFEIIAMRLPIHATVILERHLYIVKRGLCRSMEKRNKEGVRKLPCFRFHCEDSRLDEDV